MSAIEGGAKIVPAKPVLVLIDDDRGDIERLRPCLAVDFEVHVSSGGREALRLLQTLPALDVLIVDDDMPAMPGSEILRFVQDMLPSPESIVKILLLSPPPNGGRSEPAVWSAVDFRCVKPVDPAALRRKIKYFAAKRSREKRAAWRVTLNEPGAVRVDAGPAGDAKVVNISETGIFLRTLSFFPEGATIPLKIMLPDGRQYAVTGRIARHDPENGGVGVEFQSLDETDRDSILEFMSDYVTAKDLPELKERYPFLRTEEMVVFEEPLKIQGLMQRALSDRIEIIAILPHTNCRQVLNLTDFMPSSHCVFSGEDLHYKFKTSEVVFVSFAVGDATYCFETVVCRLGEDGRRMVCLYPKIVFYSEKRLARRISPRGDLSLEIPLPSPFEGLLRGRVTDISPEGVSFVVDSDGLALLSGTPLETLRILDGDLVLWEDKGEIRNVSRIGNGGDARLRYGIQFGISRRTIRQTDVPVFDTSVHLNSKTPATDTFLHANPPLGRRPAAPDEGPSRHPPDMIRLENARNEEIVGILNSSLPFGQEPIPVVLIPPAFGKTKEILFALASTLVTNFAAIGEPLATLRYDGIRRKGESFKDLEAQSPPYEMVNASLSQGADDIKAVLDWIEVNPRFRASRVIIVTFSLSALEARLALRDEQYRKKVDYWISCLGTPELRHLLTRVNCGLDLLEQYQLGISLGIMPVLGNLVNVDKYMEDGIRHQIATLDQARQDMKIIDIPVTWIYGEYDHWVRAEFIRDIMGVKAPADRDVLKIPLGHSARTSEEALRMFGTITSLVHRQLHGELLKPVLPSRDDLEFMRLAERDRLPPRKLKNRNEYWQRYLVGEQDLFGFDVLKIADDYQQLMRDQWAALDLRPDDRLLDLGGGTGNFVEHILTAPGELPRRIIIADLIPKALKQARSKLRMALDGPLRGRFGLFVCDLEIDRYRPVHRFMNGEVPRFRDLVDRIEKLTVQAATRIDERQSSRLHRILRGEPITREREAWLKRTFDLPEYKTIVDFNQAVRFVCGLLDEPPLYRQLVLPAALDNQRFLPARDGSFDKILMSLVLSYIFNPVETLIELRRVLKPDGRLVLSSLLPDADASGLFTRLVEKVERIDQADLPAGWDRAKIITSIRSFLNDAQALVELEEAGAFDFFDPGHLGELLEEAGFSVLQTIQTFGNPPQGYIVVAGSHS